MFDVIVGFPRMKVGVATRDARVVELRFLPPETPTQAPTSELSDLAKRQLERYRENPDARFDLPVLIEGTELQRGVWNAMCAIPRGRTRTYGELARELGADARAIGQACGDNRLPLVIPCHRIVAADGIGGYLLDVKRWLLAHEAPAFELRP